MTWTALCLSLLLAAAPPAPATPASATPTTVPADAPAAAEGDPADAPAVASPGAQQQTVEALRAAGAADARTEQVKANRAAVDEVLSIHLSNDDAGELLREARRRAPEPSEVGRKLDAREREVAEARLDRVRLLERRRLAGTPAEARRLSAELATQDAYLAALEKALAAQRRLAVQAQALVALLDEELLWIGSAPPVGPAWVADVARGAAWAGDPESWLSAARTFTRRLGQAPVTSAMLTLLVGGLTFSRRRLVGRFEPLAREVGSYGGDGFLLTVRAMLVTVLLALPVPLALGGAGWLLVTQSADAFAQALGRGLLAAGAVHGALNVFRHLCRPHGVAEAHFGWDAHARRVLAGNLRWLLAVEVPVSLVVAGCEASGDEVYRQGLGRAAFLVGSVGLTAFVARVLRPGRGVFSEVMSRDGWAWRLRKAWYAALVGLPAALTLAAAAGYYYTATELQSRFFYTGLIALTGFVAYSLATRWLLVARKRLAIRQARQRLADAREARRQRTEAARLAAEGGDPASATDAASGDATPDLDAGAVNVEAAGAQTLALVRTAVGAAVLAGLWAVWGDVLPALSVLQRVALTDPTVNAEGAVVIEPVTLWSLLLGAFAAVLTVVAARNLPAVLELVVLQRFPLDAGVRFAAATLARYLCVAVGVVVGSRLVGIDWGKAQWIIAALGVGLGFGLQEIVANFVSGLIILFERPVRVGDTVTVGDVTGTVSRLQIRATTLTDFDNKEVIVPNKGFITDRVVNWTLSNPVTRLLIPVGVAYGSDVAATREAITAAVRGVPTVLAEPAPSVLFVRFGDSSLDFEVRAFVGELSKRLQTTHELHVGIDAALRAAGIEIPFPQRDLHLRSVDAGAAIGLRRSRGEPAPSNGDGADGRD